MSVANKTSTTRPKTAVKQTEPKSVRRAKWLLLLLLPLALFLPLVGELIQVLLIGEEHVCCMPDNLDQLLKRAETAQSLRWLSNLIIGGSIVLGIALAFFAFVMIYRKIISNLNQRYRSIATVVLAVVCTYIVIILSLMLIYFVSHNDYYFKYRAQPGYGGLYDGTWFNPISWMIG